MPVHLLPEQRTGLGEFVQGASPYLQLAFQTMMQKRLQEQQDIQARQRAQELGLFAPDYEQALRGLPKTQIDLAPGFQMTPELWQKAYTKITGKTTIPSQYMRFMPEAAEKLPVGLEMPLGYGMTYKRPQPDILTQMAQLELGKGIQPEKPTEQLPKGYEWALEPIKVKGISVGQQWQPQAIKLSANVEKQQKSIHSARDIIEHLKKMLNKIPAKSGIEARIRGSILRGKAALGEYPEAAAYERLRKAVFGQMAKVVSGETGRLTDQDIARIEDAIPSLLSTKEERELSFQALEDILKESEGTFGLIEKQPQQPIQQQLPSGFSPDEWEIIQ